ncbi:MULTISPECIES: hypothetical protein [Stenotrophomonas]|uniref:hypothetical protein n=1 Tax=Stenotrophomonas TaxID=40323 RepID=UPI00191FF543|nr:MULTISPECIES: hypothetical protein [Stenotrophomonas]MBL0734723.1 hypothetical protein [Stenotrophomonas maltophilia]MBL0756685.1 hypothetical protein [Stenotrophomonas maltophilia]
MPIEILIAPAAPAAESASEFWKYGLPVVSLVAGILLKAGLDFFLERRRDAAQEAKRLVERRDALRAKRIEAERGNLLAVQPVLVGLLHAGRKVRNARTAAQTTGEDWSKATIDPELVPKVEEWAALLLPIRARIHSSKVTTPMDTFINKFWKAFRAKSNEEAESLWDETSSAHTKLQAEIGRVIKQLEDENYQLKDPPAS